MFEQLKKQRLQAMKDKDTQRANMIATLLSEASRNSKQPDHNTVIKTVKKFIKDAEETRDFLEKNGRDSSRQYQELDYLKSLLPAEMSEEEISKAVQQSIKETKAETMKDMSSVMSNLKNNYGPELDMKIASTKVKQQLS